MLPKIVALCRERFVYYKHQAERAIDQLEETEFHQALGPGGNSVAVIVQHMTGNIVSRWTDFLTSDGEKPDRDRDSEFVALQKTKADLMLGWDAAWAVLFESLDALREEDLERSVFIRGEPLGVLQATLRQLTHQSEHVGQIVLIAKTLRGDAWQTLSIARGQSEAYTRASLAKHQGESPHHG